MNVKTVLAGFVNTLVAAIVAVSVAEAAGSGADWIAPTGENPVQTPKDREETFEFAEKPRIRRLKTDGAEQKWVVTFAAKGACDATVRVVDKDGRTVRHLASGVLGENAPWPFKQGSLSQEIEWDGKDDRGRPAPEGCRVQVGLGLKASFGAAINPEGMNDELSGIACDRDGNLYVAWKPGSKLPVHIRFFSRDGKRCQTISPPHGDLKPEGYTGFRLVGPEENQFFVPVENASKATLHNVVGMAISSKGRIVLNDYGWRMEKRLVLIQTDGSDLKFGAQVAPWQLATGSAFVAFNKDETKVYISGVDRGMHGRYEGWHAVFLRAPDEPLPEQWNRKRARHKWNGFTGAFVGDPEKSGTDNEHFNTPRGVATDKDGNVYVCDYLNDRVQVYSPEARHLRTIPVERPYEIKVHRENGAIYVLVPRQTKIDSKRFGSSKVIKFSPEGSELYSFEFPGACDLVNGWQTSMALDDSAEPAYVYLMNAEQMGMRRFGGLWRVADKGDGFEKLADLAGTSFEPLLASYNAFITVDTEEKYLYNKTGPKRVHYKTVSRIDLEKGEVEEGWRLPVVVQPMDEISLLTHKPVLASSRADLAPSRC